MVVMGANATTAVAITAAALLLVQAAATDPAAAGCCSSASQRPQNLTDVPERNECNPHLLETVQSCLVVVVFV